MKILRFKDYIKSIKVNENKDFTEMDYKNMLNKYFIFKNWFGKNNNILEELFRIFNIDHPADFKGHSLSVSDIVILDINDKTSSWYCDDTGWTEIK